MEQWSLPLPLVGGPIPSSTVVTVPDLLAIWIVREEALALPATVPGRSTPRKNWIDYVVVYSEPPKYNTDCDLKVCRTCEVEKLAK